MYNEIYFYNFNYEVTLLVFVLVALLGVDFFGALLETNLGFFVG